MTGERGRDPKADDPIEERLVEGDAGTEREIRDAAEEAFEEDQRENPDHPANQRRRDVGEMEDPVHSKGSQR